jgi:ABC-type transport system involved in multi-copper enzyme maturation permease subunit
MFWNVLMAEQFKIWKRTVLQVELLLLAGVTLFFTVAFFVVLPALPDNPLPPPTLPEGLINLLGVAAAPLLGGSLVVVLVGAVAGSEYQWHTLHLWLSHGVPRVVLLGARAVALLLAILLIPLVTLVVGGLLSLVMVYWQAGTVFAGQVNGLEVVLSGLRVAYALVPYGALALLLAVVGRSTDAPIAGGIGFIVGEGFVSQGLMMAGGALGRLSLFLPNGLGASLLHMNLAIAEGGAPGPAGAAEILLSPAVAVTGIATWTLLFFVPALWLFQRQDITG